jgi:MFS family permease
VDGHFVADVLPSMVLLGIGAGIAFNPVLMAAMGDVAPEDSGLASGLVNTSFTMGGALGLAVLASLAAARSSGHATADAAALLDGYHAAFLAGALLALVAAVVGFRGLRPRAEDEVPDGWTDGSEPELVCAS